MFQQPRQAQPQQAWLLDYYQNSSISPLSHVEQRSSFSFETHPMPPSAATSPDSSRTPSGRAIVTESQQLARKRSFKALSSSDLDSPIALTGTSCSSTALSSPSAGVPPSLGLSSVSIGTPLVEVDAEHEDDESGLYDDESMYMADSGGGGCSRSASTGGRNSPVEGNPSGAEESPTGSGMGATMGVIGKPMGINNFVTKLYQMINDSKSCQFISWTELGTSFVVSNVGEFSRNILGSHFKHNNFSSFVRQLNMYGFHKINRTLRSQRPSTDAQTWEFSHHKFLRGRPELLDEIKRKAFGPDPSIKQQIELPSELASQLNTMKDEVQRSSSELAVERRKVDRLTTALCQLWDAVGKSLPVPPMPLDLLDSSQSPNVFVTSSNASRFAPPPLSIHATHIINSPTPSPTTNEFPFSSHGHPVSHHGHGVHSHPQQYPHPLSRQHSFHRHQQNGVAISRERSSTSSTPLASSPSPGSLSASMSMDMDDGSCHPPVPGRVGLKRQRLDDSFDALGTHGGRLSLSIGMGPSTGSSESRMGLMSSVSSPGAGPGPNNLTMQKKSNMRPRSDSAPLGYVSNASGGELGYHSSWGPTHTHGFGGGIGGGHPVSASPSLHCHSIAGRPRSGSGMMHPRIAIPSINISVPPTPIHSHGHISGR